MRYIGSKTKILPILEDLLREKGLYQEGLTFCDAFSGTATVGDYFQQFYRIIANDSLYASYYLSVGKLKNVPKFIHLGIDPFEHFNNTNTDNYTQGFCYNNFAPTMSGRMYFSDENAKLIDYIRDTIDTWHDNSQINDEEKSYLIASLLESLSKVSNVAGVYSAFLRTWDSRALKRMTFIPVERISAESSLMNECYCDDVNNFIRNVEGDILYLDPPYTQTQYISQYHVLETIARNDSPITHGVGAHRDNGSQISRWCKKEYVGYELEKLLTQARFRYIILSYSDAGLMSKDFIEKLLKRYAVEGSYTFQQIDFVKYKSTRAVNREIANNTRKKKHYEWLFFIEKTTEPKYISPLNYIGGKFEMLPLLTNNTPNDIDTFYDLFGGGGTVAINAKAQRVVYNDINPFVSQLLNKITKDDIGKQLKYIERTIKKFILSKANKNSYIKFRNYYNSRPPELREPLDLYLLICFGFEHQIRYNSSLEFNNPCGNSGYNQEMAEKLIAFNMKAKEMNIDFLNHDYLHFENIITPRDFVYCDPPYLISCGAYNDGKRGFNGWDKKQETELLEFLERLNRRGIRFMLSNMTDRNGICNTHLQEWIIRNKFKVIENNTLTKRNRQNRKEIIVINY